MDGLLSHVDARWQLVPVEFHHRGSVNVEPIPIIMAHRRSLRAQALPNRAICIWRTSKQAPGCRQLSSKQRRLKVTAVMETRFGEGHEETINRLSSLGSVIDSITMSAPTPE